jgi:hypothetical protein
LLSKLSPAPGGIGSEEQIGSIFKHTEAVLFSSLSLLLMSDKNTAAMGTSKAYWD